MSEAETRDYSPETRGSFPLAWPSPSETSCARAAPAWSRPTSGSPPAAARAGSRACAGKRSPYWPG
ncbi:hypothetical protein [Streptomyces nigra]|uniref:hypothetical protein n=1 Tax=Streptomyces nigra TaxID=1827580 RepID=UPI003F4DF63C